MPPISVVRQWSKDQRVKRKRFQVWKPWVIFWHFWRGPWYFLLSSNEKPNWFTHWEPCSMLKTQTNHWYSYFPRADKEWYAIFSPLMWFSKAEDVGIGCLEPRRGEQETTWRMDQPQIIFQLDPHQAPTSRREPRLLPPDFGDVHHYRVLLPSLEPSECHVGEAPGTPASINGTVFHQRMVFWLDGFSIQRDPNESHAAVIS